MHSVLRTIVPLLVIGAQLVFPFHRLEDCCTAWIDHHGLPPVEDFDHKHESNGLGQPGVLASPAEVERDCSLADIGPSIALPAVAPMDLALSGAPTSFCRGIFLEPPPLSGRILRAHLSSLQI